MADSASASAASSHSMLTGLAWDPGEVDGGLGGVVGPSGPAIGAPVVGARGVASSALDIGAEGGRFNASATKVPMATSAGTHRARESSPGDPPVVLESISQRRSLARSVVWAWRYVEEARLEPIHAVPAEELPENNIGARIGSWGGRWGVASCDGGSERCL